jgi:arginine/ornithine N-succinyltransferase beta subunit
MSNQPRIIMVLGNGHTPTPEQIAELSQFFGLDFANAELITREGDIDVATEISQHIVGVISEFLSEDASEELNQ